MTIDPRMHEQALQWAVATADPHFDDWDGFTAWLESDPAHARAYDAIAGAAADFVDADRNATVAPANDNAGGAPSFWRVRRRGLLAGTLAASLALVVSIGFLRSSGEDLYITAPGETRVIALDDGSTVTLAGDTRLVMADESRRVATLTHGQALFTVHHDADRPFEVRAGDNVLRDIGTIFEVQRRGDATSVAVSEGAVLFNPARQKVTVTPGQRALRTDGSDRIELVAHPAALVGEWREGRQTFRDTPLTEVAAAMTSATGVRFTVAPAAADVRISGSVQAEPIKRDPASLGPLLGVTARRTGDAWVLER